QRRDPAHGREGSSALGDARRLDAQPDALDRRAVDGRDDALGVLGGHAEEGEALEQLDIADGLAVEPGLLRDRVDEVGDLEALAAAGRGDELGEALVAVGRHVRLGVAARALGDLRRGGVRARGPRGDRGADVALDGLELALLARLDEGDGAAAAPDAARAADAM